MKNSSIDSPRVFTDGDLVFTEIIRQEYSDCVFSCGYVENAPRKCDTVYFQVEKRSGEISTQILMRPDELAAIAWVTSGALWSVLMTEDDKP